jgi:hypothetical protein
MPNLSDCVFNWMRHEFAMLLGICERDIRPDTPLDRFLPSDRRREFWNTAQRRLGVRFPTLQLPPALHRAGRWVALASAARTLVVGLVLGAKWFVLPLAIASGVLAAAFYFGFTLRWATERPDLATFGDLSRLLLAGNMRTFRRQFGIKPNREEIFATVVAVLSRQLGVDPREITPQTTFSELTGC